MAADQSLVRYQSRDQRDRLRALGATLLVHAALLSALLIQRPDIAATAIDHPLNIFDVAPLPPPPPPEPVPPPSSRARPLPRSARPTNAGGAPRRSPAPPLPSLPVPTIIDAPDVTLLPEMLALPVPANGSASDKGGDTQAAGGSGGTGQGAGTGRGDGDALSGGAKPDRYGLAAWIYHPTEDEMRAYWPKEAKRKQISGFVVLSCTLRSSGQPKRCITLSEFPQGAGFGDAAIRLSPTFRIRHVMRNKKPLDVPVSVPISFDYKRL